MNEGIQRYLRGESLYGDDFSPEDIREWYAAEAEAYAELGAYDRKDYEYSYHQLNWYHAYRFLEGQQFAEALGLGAAYGDEFEPIANRIGRITILESSKALVRETGEVGGTPCRYVQANQSGSLPFDSAEFDLLTSFGVLHHVPNVSHVVQECHRCLKVGGVMLLREPIVSMGDWRQPRRGLTKRERGIPIEILRNIIGDAGLRIRREALCVFPVIQRLASKLRIKSYNSALLTRLDALLSELTATNVRYHRTRLWHRFAPMSAYFILQKP